MPLRVVGDPRARGLPGKEKQIGRKMGRRGEKDQFVTNTGSKLGPSHPSRASLASHLTQRKHIRTGAMDITSMLELHDTSHHSLSNVHYFNQLDSFQSSIQIALTAAS